MTELERMASVAAATPTGRARLAPVVAPVVLAAAVGLAAVVAVVALRAANDGAEPADHNWWLVGWLSVGVADSMAGAVVVTRPGHRRLGITLVIVGAAGSALAVATQAAGFAAAGGSGAAWKSTGAAGAWLGLVASGALAGLVAWDLGPAGGRRRIEWVWWTTALAIAAGAMLTARGLPTDLPHPIALLTALVVVSATAATARLVIWWWRQRATSDDPLPAWAAAGSSIAWAALVPGLLAELDGGSDPGLPGHDVASPLLLMATVPTLVVSAVVGAIRDRPSRIHGVSDGVIGWVALCGAIVVVYTGLVAGLGRLVGGDGPTWLLVAATGLIAVAVEPARQRIRAAVDGLVYGARNDPLHVVRGVVDHVGADTGDELLPALAETLQRELRLDAVAVDVRTSDGWRREAAAGDATTHQRIVELSNRDQVVGRLVVGWEHGPSLRARDERLLREVAGPVGLAVGWVRLAGELRASSLAVVSAREEERRRLRRDLHDGLGPGLTGVSLGVRTALRQLSRSPERVDLATSCELLERTADDVDSLVGEIKRIVRDLRPTALDQLGLSDAVVEFTRAFDDSLDFELRLPATPMRLPAAVEVAAYRIVTEAVTNVVRHARASRCWLTITAGSVVDIEVVDDGIGVRSEAADGVGWTAMRERAAELGGTMRVSPGRPHGTVVHVALPGMLP